MYYIGVDLGTSSVKLLLMDKQGTVVKTVSKEYPISFPKPGWSEQNPYDWYEQSVAGIRELTVGIKKEEVAGISFGGQMHGLVILDENDKVKQYNRQRKADRVHGKHRICGIYGTEDFVGTGK